MPFLLFFLIPSIALSTVSKRPLELELDSYQYEALLEESQRFDETEKHVLTPVMEMGKKNLEWLKFINKHRSPNNQISFTSPQSQPAYPVDKPRISNPTITLKEYESIKSELPTWFKDILFNGAAFTVNPPVTDQEYVKLGLLVDFNYQRAARWILQEPSLAEYSKGIVDDVRGYYYFTQDPSLKEELKDWKSLSQEDQNQFRTWLIGLCLNKEGTTEKTCEESFDGSVLQSDSALGYYHKYYPAGAAKWNTFFDLKIKRPDVEWHPKDPDLMKAAFLEPKDAPEIKQFLIDNIEDEWKWENWALKLDFKSSGDFPKMVFKAGSTPNVNALGGNIITMDQNTPLTEYNVRWTIRHEYGHVLGFPDCYVEFYDKKMEAMVSYQLDTTNLMCSRRGKLKETHYLELKKQYLP